MRPYSELAAQCRSLEARVADMSAAMAKVRERERERKRERERERPRCERERERERERQRQRERERPRCERERAAAQRTPTTAGSVCFGSQAPGRGGGGEAVRAERERGGY
jgi:chromosome segregation ATPase